MAAGGRLGATLTSQKETKTADVTRKGQKATAEQGPEPRACSAIQSPRVEETSHTGRSSGFFSYSQASYEESGAEAPPVPWLPG